MLWAEFGRFRQHRPQIPELISYHLFHGKIERVHFYNHLEANANLPLYIS